MAEDSPNVKKETDIQVQEAQRVLNKVNTKKPRLTHTIIKMEKLKREFKRQQEKKKSHMEGNSHKAISYFSAQTLQATREWHDIFKMLKGKNLQSSTPYPARLSFRIEGEIKSFSDKQKLKEFINTKLTTQEVLKGFL